MIGSSTLRRDDLPSQSSSPAKRGRRGTLLTLLKFVVFSNMSHGDTFETVESEGWAGRLGGSCKSIGGGLLAVVIGIGLLGWNEWNCVGARRSLQEAERLVIDLSTSIATIDGANDGKLVHLMGLAAPEGPQLTDSTFAVSPPEPALKMARTVEMYQWTEKTSTEEKKKTGGGTETKTTYSYMHEWVRHVVDSSQFEYPINHENPHQMPFDQLAQTAGTVKMGAFELSYGVMGAFELSYGVMDQVNWYVPLVSTNFTTKALPAANVSDFTVKLYQDKGYYFGKDPSNPSVGDVRVTFSYVPQQKISVIARQTGASLTAYTTSNKREILLVNPGMQTVDQMFVTANNEVIMMTWVLRIVGFLAIWLGLSAVAKPISVMADVLPFLGNLLEAGLGAVAFLTALVISTIVIAIAWFVFRPLLSLGLLAGVGAISYGIWKYRKKQNAQSQYGAIPEAEIKV